MPAPTIPPRDRVSARPATAIAAAASKTTFIKPLARMPVTSATGMDICRQKASTLGCAKVASARLEAMTPPAISCWSPVVARAIRPTMPPVRPTVRSTRSSSSGVPDETSAATARKADHISTMRTITKVSSAKVRPRRPTKSSARNQPKAGLGVIVRDRAATWNAVAAAVSRKRSSLGERPKLPPTRKLSSSSGIVSSPR
jgi:hypothetical protein